MPKEKEEILKGTSLTKEAVMKRCQDDDRDVEIIMEDGRKEKAVIGVSRRDRTTITKKGTGGLDLFLYEMKSIKFLSKEV